LAGIANQEKAVGSGEGRNEIRERCLVGLIQDQQVERLPGRGEVGKLAGGRNLDPGPSLWTEFITTVGVNSGLNPKVDRQGVIPTHLEPEPLPGVGSSQPADEVECLLEARGRDPHAESVGRGRGGHQFG
jgi:hypothetical protein